MNLDNRKREVQLEAGKAWIESGCKGTIELNTGGGKTFIAFDAMLTLPKGSTVLFLAETTQREKDVIDDSKVYLSFFGINPLHHVDFEFACYQSAYKWKGRKFDLVVGDEIHSGTSKEYFKFFKNNTYNKILCLTATRNEKVKYFIDGKIVTKGELIESIAPVCYTYGIADAQREGTGRKLDIHIIEHQLESVKREIIGGSKLKPFMNTEKRQYEYWDKLFIKGIEEENFKLTKVAVSKRSRLLYSLPSKIESTRKLLKYVTGKSIIFNNDLDALEKVTPNVVSAPRHGRSKKEQDEFNSILRENFDKGHIRTIGSFKVLQQGANLKQLDNVILMSYDSKSGGYQQKIGRLRKNLDKRGKVFMFVTQDTVEVDWYNKIVSDFPMEEFNVIRHMGVDECIEYLKQ